MHLYGDGDTDRPLRDPDGEKPWRDNFMRDYGRVIHSASFRRLQGKTQVFPGHESDFFRNRLTHSLEVAQIAEGIVDRLNHVDPYFQNSNLNSRLCATAALLHDLGHPPFGHNGERALDAMMVGHGGFEGNAQTLRIISQLEKKVFDGAGRYGLNMTFRTLAAVLKYDKEIPIERESGSKVAKGFYASEADLVANIKVKVTGGQVPEPGAFKTVECALMDLADDIAYSTFDLEDALKVGFLTPGYILASSKELLAEVARIVSREMGREVSSDEVIEVFQNLFEGMIGTKLVESLERTRPDDMPAMERALEVFAGGERASLGFVDSGHLRTKLSSQLVKDAIDGVGVKLNDAVPALTKVFLNDEAKLRVEVLKQYVYVATISTHRVKIAEYRGTRIVKDIFTALSEKDGSMLLPLDVKHAHELCADKHQRMRVVCDFIAGMTDRYASEFHARLHSEAPQSMFKPL
ncbi:dGTP triphosphohydrolase [Lichenifustis flavocetrariae]|uniref:Deoxyguanosinetriphosphate triphosphohydrolase-like protein n=1 Tax=Lichenifustis flavocetrariae TaxID=2949735 RepID=A0AA41YWE7_9HYPH|nr:dNTP triphosphohydrolase [Lichenifustis flavocetrariae]MCW6509839.1 dNTP triphosphohydrolase [Lichenifustis flavocetrariae]